MFFVQLWIQVAAAGPVSKATTAFPKLKFAQMAVFDTLQMVRCSPVGGRAGGRAGTGAVCL